MSFHVNLAEGRWYLGALTRYWGGAGRTFRFNSGVAARILRYLPGTREIQAGL